MDKKILFLVFVILMLLGVGFYFWLQKTTVPALPSGTTTSTQPITKVKNPTISNSANDLVGNNNLEAVGLVWDRETSAAKYVIFRSDSINGPFTELRRIRADINIRTNTEDITPDARTKTLCYKIEARDGSGKVIRVYEPVCVSKWQE